MKIVYYALGGGHGHAVRGMAVARSLTHLDPKVEATLIVPERHLDWAREEGLTGLAPPQEARSTESLGQWLLGTLDRLAPHRLIVDVFPRGVLGELAKIFDLLKEPPWLLSRLVRTDYYRNPSIQEFIEKRYERLLWCEPPSESLRGLGLAQDQVSPVLIRTVRECQSRSEARRSLGVAAEEEVVLALGAGDLAHQRSLFGLLSRIRDRRAKAGARPVKLIFINETLCGEMKDPSLIARFAAMTILRAADVLVGAGGYHFFHESRSLDLPAVFVPQRRRYDDQFARV